MKIILHPEQRTERKKYERWSKHKTPKLLSSFEYDKNEQRATITAFGETRELWCLVRVVGNEIHYDTPNVFASMTQHGNKAHQDHITFLVKPNGKIGIFSTVSLNRHTRVIGWWKEDYDQNGFASQHVGG